MLSCPWHHSTPRKLSGTLTGCKSDLQIHSTIGFHFWKMSVPHGRFSLQFVATCCAPWPHHADPCFVPMLCPVESLAPTFSNHNYIPGQQQSKETQHERRRGHHYWYVVTLPDSLLSLFIWGQNKPFEFIVYWWKAKLKYCWFSPQFPQILSAQHNKKSC